MSNFKLAEHYTKFLKDHPEIAEAYQNLGKICSEKSPFDHKQEHLLKLAMAAGAQLEGAVHSHTRRALEAGASPDEIRGVVLSGIPTLGFPASMATLSWVNDILDN